MKTVTTLLCLEAAACVAALTLPQHTVGKYIILGLVIVCAIAIGIYVGRHK